ncbi:MAG: aminotransferase class III-fold pyridoxal phosphate-dependent enzyme, partial [Gammaproteobacteria bacterium]|nr:aminotransferase class III-fold pyridoxal phosphate-dependent enzyme [Gammaproteobacteria bacterium]
ISLAATLATSAISETLNQGAPGILAHGPTFMGNPLACAAAVANIDLLLASDWQANVQNIQQHLIDTLTPLNLLSGVAEVRVLGAIGVIELVSETLGAEVQAAAIANGIWLRPFGKLVYTMPAYNISQAHLNTLTQGICKAIHSVL